MTHLRPVLRDISEKKNFQDEEAHQTCESPWGLEPPSVIKEFASKLRERQTLNTSKPLTRVDSEEFTKQLLNTVSKVKAMDPPTALGARAGDQNHASHEEDRNDLVRALFSLWSMLGDCLGTVVVCVAVLLTFSISIIQTAPAAGSQLRYWILAASILCYGTLMAVGVRAFRQN